MHKSIRISLIASIAACGLLGDVTYHQTTKFTGGSLVEAMKKMASIPLMGRMGGGAMKTAFADQQHDVYIKGNKMASIGPLTSILYDLDAGTITTINHEKSTYSTMTFDELRQQMEQVQQRMHKGAEQDIEFDMKLSDTGQTRTIDGQTATEKLLTMTAKQAGKDGQMVIKSHLWLASPTAPMNEAAEFHKKLATKAAFAMGGFSPMMGSASTGLQAAMKQSFEQNGYPVLTETEVSGVAGGASSPLGAMMGQGGGDPSAPLIQTEMQTANFVTTSVDDGRFAIPAGYKEEKRRR
jgi:hypothetical protein